MMSPMVVHWTATDRVAGHRFRCVQCTTGMDRHLLTKLFAKALRCEHPAVTCLHTSMIEYEYCFMQTFIRSICTWSYILFYICLSIH